MIVTFCSQKGGVGKTTLAIAFANYLIKDKNMNVHVYDFDEQKSFYNRWLEDGKLIDKDAPNKESFYYPVQCMEEDDVDMDVLNEWSSSKDFYIIDCAGSLDIKYDGVYQYSDLLVIPFEYSNVSVHSTLVFTQVVSEILSQAKRIYVPTRIDVKYNYQNKDAVHQELKLYGNIAENPVLKRNILQTISTRNFLYRHRDAIQATMEEIFQITKTIR